MKIKKILISIALLTFIVSSCEKDFLETAPTGSLEAGTMFETIEGAEAAINGIYRYMYAFDPVYGNHDAFGQKALHIEMELMGEHMVGNVLQHGWFGQQYAWRTHRNADAGMTHLRWLVYYKLILNANNIIVNIDNVEATPTQINYIKSQALAIRAFSYYQLVQLYAPAWHVNAEAPAVPLYTEPSQEGHPRASLREVYVLIDNDLTEAITLLDGSTRQDHKSHINLPVIHGIAARANLARGSGPGADNSFLQAARQHAINAITLFGANNLYTIADYPAPFDMSEFDGTWQSYLASEFDRSTLFNRVASREWMWGMQVNDEQNTIFASFYSHMDPTEFGYAQLTNQKLISSGDDGLYHRIAETDVRRNLWVEPGKGGGPMVPYAQLKFITPERSSWAADYLFMRLSEMFLIKAEAEARLGMDNDAAETLLTLLENRDSEYTLSTNTGADLIEEIMFHRSVELWGEGLSWMDLKRTGSALNRNNKGHSIGLAAKMEYEADGIEWLWLIPTAEINANDAISSGDQNPM